MAKIGRKRMSSHNHAARESRAHVRALCLRKDSQTRRAMQYWHSSVIDIELEFCIIQPDGCRNAQVPSICFRPHKTLFLATALKAFVHVERPSSRFPHSQGREKEFEIEAIT